MAGDLLIVCLLAVACVSGYKVYTILSEYHDAENAYEKVNEVANQGSDEDGEFTGDIDFDALRAINSDVIGWIYLEGTSINYPIVKAPDNDKYLHTLFDGTAGDSGTIFTDSDTDDPFHQFNTIVYGHHMKNKTMFYDLNKFRDYDFLMEHDRFELILPDGKYHLEVAAFMRKKSDCKIYTNNIVNENEKQSYISWINQNAMYTTNLAITPEDNLVILSTCAIEAEDERYIVVGKLSEW